MKKLLYIVANPYLFTRNSVGGNISSANGVIKSFVKKGYNVDVLTDDNIPNIKNINGVETIFFPLGRLRSKFVSKSTLPIISKIFSKTENFIFRVVMYLKLKKILNVNKYEYCYIRASFHSHVILNLLKEKKIKLILEVNKPLSMSPFNNKIAENWPSKREEVFVTKSEKMQYENANIITVDSNLRAKWITDFVGDYRKKILINYNGVDTDIFKPQIKNFKLIDSLGFDKSAIIVGMASSFRWYNDVVELFKIIQRSIELNSNIKFLLVVGNLKKVDEISSQINLANLSDDVKYLVNIPFNKMSEVLNICDICISHFNFHNKWPHNCSIKHLEYLACSKPVVATNVGEVNFAIEDGVNGFLCREGDVDQFANAINALALNKTLRDELGQRGYKKVISELTWDKNIEKILNSVNKLKITK